MRPPNSQQPTANLEHIQSTRILLRDENGTNFQVPYRTVLMAQFPYRTVPEKCKWYFTLADILLQVRKFQRKYSANEVKYCEFSCTRICKSDYMH